MVYIDLLFLLNMLFDFIILGSVKYILKRNISNKRLLISSLIGNLSLILLFRNYIFLFVIIFKILLSIIMVLIAFGYKDFIYFKKNLLYFYLISIILAGGMFFLMSNISISYFYCLILGLILFIIFILAMKNLKTNYLSYYNCSLYDKDNIKVNINAFLDTGNKMIDPYTFKNIVLIDKKQISKFKLDNPIYVPYNSLNNHGMIQCFNGFTLEIDGLKTNNFLLGISDGELLNDGIDCILSVRLMEGLK